MYLHLDTMKIFVIWLWVQKAVVCDNFKVNSDTNLKRTPVDDDNSFKNVCHAVLSSGCKLLLVRGDITRYKADAIVNAANERLDHCGGVARAIVDQGTGTDFETVDNVLYQIMYNRMQVAAKP